MSFLGMSTNFQKTLAGFGELLAPGVVNMHDINPKNVDELFNKAFQASRQGEVSVQNSNPNTFSDDFSRLWGTGSVKNHFAPK
jgi:hypothetical protein